MATSRQQTRGPRDVAPEARPATPAEIHTTPQNHPEGWWLASNGRWYPPEAAQDGTWLASDGRWYPPEAKPGTQVAATTDPWPARSWVVPTYSGTGTGRLASERVVVSAPLSFSGSAARLWKMTDVNNPALKIVLGFLAVMLIMFAWMFVVCWYGVTLFLFGIFLFPFRLLRRGSRKRHQTELQHRETLAALNQRRR